ncbi:hypothetical protein [Amycolatopsis coloradensis]|uniref:hypothetical protein n=1 Tax=Amycolatopsis coloradensis TaxID=76021 RepID=UPI0013017D1D|nr:hypothetical protein [Amycolatopsis coloradensis]
MHGIPSGVPLPPTGPPAGDASAHPRNSPNRLTSTFPPELTSPMRVDSGRDERRRRTRPAGLEDERDDIIAATQELGGTVTGEHGVGLLKPRTGSSIPARWWRFGMTRQPVVGVAVLNGELPA